MIWDIRISGGMILGSGVSASYEQSELRATSGLRAKRVMRVEVTDVQIGRSGNLLCTIYLLLLNMFVRKPDMTR